MSSEAAAPTNVPGLLARAASRWPERGIALVDGRGRPQGRWTYTELLAHAEAAGARLARRGVRPRDPVLVCLGTSWEFLAHWFGALLHGALPVAVAPTGSSGAAEFHFRKVDAIAERLSAPLVVASDVFRDDARSFGFAGLSERVATPAELDATEHESNWSIAPADPNATAFLQLTSGSTGIPRAVQIPHRAPVHNSAASDDGIGAPFGGLMSEHLDHVVSWLPLNHDMGLIGCLFLAIYCGVDLTLLPPKAFLARPHVWMDHAGRHKKSLAPGPNFAFQLCVERVDAERAATLDLSTWAAAMTGAEMIRPETVEGFCERFGPAGFRPEAFRPCYGLAEATLSVTFDRRGEGVRTRPVPATADRGFGLTRVVCVGSPIIDTEVRICAPDGATLPDGQIGEVRAKGPGIFTGYYGDREATESCLTDGWLHTGDLGFVQGGELYLTGRTKDILIVHGVNLMPHEIESIAEATSGGGGSKRAAAFSVAEGAEGERVVVAVEVTEGDADSLADVEREIRVRVGRALSIPIADVAFVRRGRIPKTTSGKVQRGKVRAQYIEGELERLNAKSS